MKLVTRYIRLRHFCFRAVYKGFPEILGFRLYTRRLLLR
jgi:hypothetical protein